jgi:hypothetical protein
MKKTAFLTVLATVSALFASCEMNNETRYEGTCALTYNSTLDTTIVYANVNSDSSATATYQPDFLDPMGGYVLSHWVSNQKFGGGLTIAYSHNDTLATDENYTSVVGHGSGQLGGNFTTAYYVGDITSHPAVVMFYTGYTLGIPHTPYSVEVSNATRTYLAMKDGWTDAQGTVHAPYTGKLYLRISALSHLSTTARPDATGAYVDVELAADGQFLRSWKTVTLSQLGVCYGLRFELVDADGQAVTDVPQRFCIDALISKYNATI